MSIYQSNNNLASGLNESFVNVFPAPFVLNRAPKTTDLAQIGTIWVYPATNQSWILVSVVANVAQWNLNEAGGGSGAFSTLSSTGATTLATTGASVNTFGNATGATSVSLISGSGGISLTGATSINTGGTALTTIGNATAATGVRITAGTTGGIVISAGGQVSIVPATVTGSTASLTLNRSVGVATFTGFTTASTATQIFTISNSLISITSFVTVSITNLNTSGNGALMGILGVTQAAGSIAITAINNGSLALAGGDNVLISFVINS